MKKRMKNNKGFTLVELIVVIAIIGILVAIAVPQFSKSLASANQAADAATARSVQAAAQMYYLDYNAYPATDDVIKEEDGSKTLNVTGINETSTNALYNYIEDVTVQSDGTFDYNEDTGIVTYNEK